MANLRGRILDQARAKSGTCYRNVRSGIDNGRRHLVRAEIDALLADGRLIQAQHPDARSNSQPRLFATQELADAYLQRPYETHVEAGLRSIADGPSKHYRQPMPRPVADAHRGPPKVYVAPIIGHDPRYQVGPGEDYRGAGLRSLPPGHYTEPATSAAARAAVERLGA
jgi:hypothetical protein